MKAAIVLLATLLAAVSVADPAIRASPLQSSDVLLLRRANVLDGNPLRDAGALRHPLLVINDGRVAVDRLARPLK